MSDAERSDPAPADLQPSPSRGRRVALFLIAVLVFAGVAVAVAALIVTMFHRKQEARHPFVRQVEVSELSSDPVPWGINWPREFDSYRRTVDTTRTRYGGSEAMPQQRIDRDPWLRRMYSGYAFSIDFRDRRGHAYMLYDQEQTERVAQRPQAGACLHCHASAAPMWRRVGMQALGQQASDEALAREFNWPAVMKGFEITSTMRYADAHRELLATPDGTPGEDVPLMPGGSSATVPTRGNVNRTTAPTTRQAIAAHAGEAHPVSCVDCHDPQTMHIRVTRPGFVRGIQALATSDDPVPHLPSIERWRQGNRKQPYDPNLDATRQEMRSFVCGQCHVEYYCAPKETLLFPWGYGLKVEQIERYYDEHKFPDGTPFFDWKHGETGAPVYKAQHPEFEMWSQGIHARSGVACADCHMPYVREGALKVSDHWVRSPLLNINNACQTCHPFPESELAARVERIQDRTHKLIGHASAAVVDMLDAIRAAKSAGATEQQLAAVYKLQNKAQWRLDFVSSENSMGFHADQETARVLAESIDYARQAQVLAQSIRTPEAPPSTQQGEPVIGVTPTENAPPGPYKTQPDGRPLSPR